MMFLQRMREKIDAADHSTVNRVRIVTVLVTALVFGVALRGHMFSQETLAEDRVSVRPALVYQVVSTEDNTNEKVVAQNIQEEGDLAPVAEPVTTETEEVFIAPVLVKEANNEEAENVTLSTEGVTLSAKAYVVAGGVSGRDTIYEKNAHTQLAPASVTKLMTAVIVTEYADPGDVITITPRAVNAEGVAGSLRVGETFSVSDLLHVMLVISSNDAATAFEDHFSSQGLDLISLMNEKARLLGMVNTHFANPTGLDEPEHYSTAADLAVLAAYSLRHEQIWDILSKTSESVRSLNKKILHTLLSNNELLHKKRKDILGGKTGYTKNAGGCMITVLRSGEVVVVLGSNDRAGDTQQLIQLITNN